MGAGEIQTNSQGKIVCISAKSGHYNPGKSEMLNTLKFLKDNQVNLEKIKVVIPGHHDDHEDFVYNNANEFLLSNGNMHLDGLDSATFEREEGKITTIHQHNPQIARSNNYSLLKKIQDREDLDLSNVVFKEDTSWGAVFVYNALEYLKGINRIPISWDGGLLIHKAPDLFEIRTLKQFTNK